MLEIRLRLTVSSFELGAQAAAAALGILRAPLSPVKRLLEAGDLVRVLEEWSEPGAEVFALLPPAGASLPKTRIFLDRRVAWYAAREPDTSGARSAGRGRGSSRRS